MILAVAGMAMVGMAAAETAPEEAVIRAAEEAQPVAESTPDAKAKNEVDEADDSCDSLTMVQRGERDYAKGMEAYNRGYYSRAVKLFAKSAERQHVGAMLKLGGMYDTGEGVIKNLKAAFSWYKKAADEGDPVGEYKVGMMYLRGQGVKRSYDEAAAWIRKSADQGYPRAQTNYGSLHLVGLGVEQDFIQAVEWFRKAADQNYGEAQYLMGVAYEYGEGVAQDKEQAKAWYGRAVKNGSGNATGPLYRLEGYKR
jgi:TPR repeat protein